MLYIYFRNQEDKIMSLSKFIVDFFRPNKEALQDHLERFNKTPEEFAEEHGESLDVVISWLDGSKNIPFKYSSIIYSSHHQII